MEKESKVTGVQGNGTWNGKDGTLFYRHEISFENGDSGEYSSKTQDQQKFVLGQMAKYTLTQSAYGNKIKPVYSSGGGGYSRGGKSPETEARIARMNALGHAMTMLEAQAIQPTQIEQTANKFYSYIMTGSMAAPQPQDVTPNFPTNNLI